MRGAGTGTRRGRSALAVVWLCLAGLTLGTSATQASAVPPKSVDFDVVVYGTQTSGLAAVAELTAGAPHLRVALISAGDYLESPLAQGLGAEDAVEPGRVAGGFYKEWRRTVIRDYAYEGQRAFTSGGRLVYAPEAAADALRSVAGLGEDSRVGAVRSRPGGRERRWGRSLRGHQRRGERRTAPAHPVLHRRQHRGRPGPRARCRLPDRPR